MPNPNRILNPRRLADFGLSRLMDNDQSHISTQTFGTIPYMPPELLADGRMTRAVDVYSFGIISARPAFRLRLHPVRSVRCMECRCVISEGLQHVIRGGQVGPIFALPPLCRDSSAWPAQCGRCTAASRRTAAGLLRRRADLLPVSVVDPSYAAFVEAEAKQHGSSQCCSAHVHHCHTRLFLHMQRMMNPSSRIKPYCVLISTVP